MGGGNQLPRSPSIINPALSPSPPWNPGSQPPSFEDDVAVMDPLSLAASIIAVVGLAAKVVKGLDDLSGAVRDAPGDILALNNEVADLQAILSVASQFALPMLSCPLDASSSFSLLSVHIAFVQENLTRLDTLLDKCVTNGSKLALRTRWLRERHRANTIRRALRSARENLNTSLLLVTLTKSSRVELIVEEIHAGLNKPVSSHPKQWTKSDSRRNTDEEAFNSPNPATAPVSPLLELATTAPETEVVAIHTSHPNYRCCSRWCSCACHKRGYLDLNSPLKLILGALFIGYTGIPIFTPPCNERSCKRRSTLTFDIVYYFPIWFLARALCVSLKFTPSVGSQMTLKTPRLIRWVHKEAQLFHLAQAGDIPGIQKMFTTGIVSPIDMTAAQGETALFHAVSFAQFETCKFLLDAGADATAVNMYQVSSVDVAWQWILSGQLDSKTVQFVQGLFADGEFVESRQFSIIHKVVLGLLPAKCLSVELEASTSGIDAADSGGKTSLAWAAFRADRKSLQLLLDHGADMNKPDKSGNYPLHYAALTRDSCCIQPLLDAGAAIDPRNTHLQTPLHLASKEHDDPSFIEQLLRAGADVDRGDCEGETPLMYAVRGGQLCSAKTLLTNGANINARTIWGLTVLDICILYGAPTTLEFLLQAGAKVSSKDVYGRTILHQVASHGSANMVRTLLDHRLQGVDVDAVDSDGISMWNVLEAKGQPKFTELFEVLRRKAPEDHAPCAF